MFYLSNVRRYVVVQDIPLQSKRLMTALDSRASLAAPVNSGKGMAAPDDVGRHRLIRI